MKSIKPGRGPSFMGGVMGICSGVFGIVWTIVAASVGGGIFALFGIVFIAVSVVTALYNFRNATGKNRYSAYDIVDGKEESDPLNERFSIKSNADDKLENEKNNVVNEQGVAFCPYCGAKVADDFRYCHKCGKQLPED